MNSFQRIVAAVSACGGLLLVGAFLAGPNSADARQSWPGATTGFAPLPTSTTTIPAFRVITPATTTTLPSALVPVSWPDDETTPPSPPPVETSVRASVTTLPARPTAPTVAAATGPSAAVVGGPAASVTVAVVAARSGDEVVVGELSGDPSGWTAEVLDYVAAENVDLASQSGAAGGGAPGALVSNEGCAVQCITSGVAYAVGTGAHLRITTSTPATIRITVFGESMATSPSPSIQWGHTWPHLHSNTVYTALARAEDANGNVAFASGTFTTLNRYTQIDLESIGIDPHPPYDHPHLHWVIDGVQQPQAEGGLFALPLALWAPTTPVASTVELQFQAVLHDHQSDCSPFDSSCNSGYYGDVVAATFELDAYPENAVSWTSHEFATVLAPPCIPPTLCDEPTPLAYSAAVRVLVWYDA